MARRTTKKATVSDDLISDWPKEEEEETRSLISVDPTADVVSDYAEYRPRTVRNLKDLPAEGNLMKGLSVIFVLTLLGISDNDICAELKVTREELDVLRKGRGYKETFEMVLSELINVNSQAMVGRLTAYSNHALQELVNISFNSKKEGVRMSGVKDILDRAGVGKAFMSEHEKRAANELRIVIEKADEAQVKFED